MKCYVEEETIKFGFSNETAHAKQMEENGTR